MVTDKINGKQKEKVTLDGKVLPESQTPFVYSYTANERPICANMHTVEGKRRNAKNQGGVV